MSFFNALIAGLVMVFFEIYIYYIISGEKINLKNYNLYFVYIFHTTCLIINYLFLSNMLKVIITFVVMVISIKLLFKKRNLINCINLAFVTEMIVIISEIVFATTVSLFENINNSVLVKNYEGAIITNICISILTVLIAKIPFVKKCYLKLCNLTRTISKYFAIIILGFVIFLCSLLFNLSYYDYSQTISLIVNTFIIMVYFTIVVMVIYKDNKYHKIYSKYSMTMDELEEYEAIINDYRVINHESKNQLTYIKGMTTNKKVNEYIDEILNNRFKKNDSIFNKSLLIPTGGLRGLIYSKMLVMKKMEIDYYLHVDKKINNKLIHNISVSDMIDVCQIIGVYLDNAMEEVKKSKDGKIYINIYENNGINIEVNNSIIDNLDINKIDKTGYTTKGKGHGYGLTLVNEILKSNKNIVNSRSIYNNILIQKIIIKKVR